MVCKVALILRIISCFLSNCNRMYGWTPCVHIQRIFRPVVIYLLYLKRHLERTDLKQYQQPVCVYFIYLSTFVHVYLYENISRLNLFLNFLNENTKMNPYKIENSVNTGHPILTVILNNMKFTGKFKPRT